MQSTHKSPFAGTWYPSDGAELESMLGNCLEQSRKRTGSFLFPEALAYVVPHAGPAYSGTVAAAVYRSLAEQRPERIVILGFPHRGGLRGVAAPDSHAISTPLGEVSLNGDLSFPRRPESALCDHSVEIQLPFLQQAAARAEVTVLYVGRMDAPERQAAAERLAAAWRPGTVFVASSDFTHYGRAFDYLPFPTDKSVEAHLRELDYACIDAAGALDSTLFLRTIATRNANLCGAAPIALLVETLARIGDGDFYQWVLDYQTSGEIAGDYRHSVSYAALGYFPRHAFDVAPCDCEALLDAAARTLDTLRRSREHRPSIAEGTDALGVRRGAFVTLRQGGELLGCLGNASGHKPLREEVSDLTLSAALDDPRFRPAAQQPGPIDIEISLLTPFRRIRDTSGFQLGKHGAVLALGGHLGLLLPQVAPERGWTSAQFWRALAHKGGLPPFAWSDPRARLEVFGAQIFHRSGGRGKTGRAT